MAGRTVRVGGGGEEVVGCCTVLHRQLFMDDMGYLADACYGIGQVHKTAELSARCILG